MADYKLEDQKKDENIKLLTRAHPWVLAKTGFRILALALVVFIIFLIFKASSVTAYSLFVFLAVSIMFILYGWFTWHNSLSIITNRRIIEVGQSRLFLKFIRQASMNKIQDVAYTRQGLAQTLLNYGTIEIQTAGAVDKIKFQNVPNPSEIQKMIFRYSDLSPEKKKRRIVIR